LSEAVRKVNCRSPGSWSEFPTPEFSGDRKSSQPAGFLSDGRFQTGFVRNLLDTALAVVRRRILKQAVQSFAGLFQAAGSSILCRFAPGRSAVHGQGCEISLRPCIPDDEFMV